jgi:hypothetical protein
MAAFRLRRLSTRSLDCSAACFRAPLHRDLRRLRGVVAGRRIPLEAPVVKKPLDKLAPSPSCPRKTSQRKIKSFSGRHNQDVDTNHCCLKVLADADVHNVVDEETLRSTTMPVFEVRKYFFDVRRSDREDEDAIGTRLSDVAAALNHAERLIRELKENGGYNDPNLMVIVRDGMKKVVLSIPFLAACA